MILLLGLSCKCYIKEENKTYYVDSIDFGMQTVLLKKEKVLCDGLLKSGTYTRYSINELELFQCIGVEDVNGTSLYLGDIVEVLSTDGGVLYKGELLYDMGSLTISIISKSDNTMYPLCDLNTLGLRLKLIGDKSTSI